MLISPVLPCMVVTSGFGFWPMLTTATRAVPFGASTDVAMVGIEIK